MPRFLEYLFPERPRYNNPALPFGPDAKMRLEYVALHVMHSRRW